MGLIIYLDGKYVPEEEAVISVFDHGVLYGDGAFEGIRAYNNHVFKLHEHLVRLYESARTLAMEIPISMEEMQEAVLETLRRNNLRDAYIRLVVTRGKGDLGLDPHNCPRPTVFCIAASIKLYPDALYEQGLEMASVTTRRNLPEACNPRVKSLNYLNSIYAKMEANLAGAAEALMLNQDGYVVEASGDNIFLVKNGKLITPPVYLGLLEGITRNTVMDVARAKGIVVEEQVFNRHDVYNADECFLTGSAAELIPCVRVDGRPIGNGKPGEVFRSLLKDFRELTKVDGPAIFE